MDLCLSRKENKALLPNLKTIIIRTPLLSRFLTPFLRLFFNETLVQLEIAGVNHPDSVSDMVSLIEDASHLSPMLRALHIQNDDWRAPFSPVSDKALGRVIAQCNLNTFQSQIQTFSSHHLAAFALQKEMDVIDLYWEDKHLGPYGIPLPNVFEVLVNPNPFPTLSNLCLRLCSKGIDNIFGSSVFPRLYCLDLEAVLNDDQEELHHYVRQIGASCPQLVHLNLLRYDNLPNSTTNLTKVIPPPRLTLEMGVKICTPLFSIPELLNLDFGHYWPVNLDNNQLIDLSRLCPRLRCLRLNPEPVRHGPDAIHITLAVLPELASNLRYLTDLRLFVNTSPEHFRNVAPVRWTFKKSRTLSFGTSPLPSNVKEWDDILTLLGQVVPIDCRYIATPYVPDFRVAERGKEVYKHRREQWEQLAGLLQVVHCVAHKLSNMSGHRD